ncbi:MAG TPA: hypothetical protein VKU82_11195, partial [Planctomycetaceae bacterium]|nr:hypothetical protein [Planctomycetaceae bacterium]
MSQNHEVEIHLPSALAEAARSIADAPLDVDAAERVRQRARALPGVEAARSRPRMGSARPVLRLTAATAAAIVISLGAWQLLGPRSAGSVLYAQVLAATKKVNTIHSVIETAGADGALVKAGELWFARGKGFAFKADGSTRIDDGKFYWEHTGSAKFASRSRSQGTDELLDQALDIKEDLKQHCQRYAAGDRVIGGVACECYSVAAPGNREAGEQADREAHTLAYISEDFLVRRVEMQKKIDGHWKMWLVRSWEYDVPVPDDVFRPAFGPGIEIVDADEAFDRVVDLRRAVFVEERAGLIFAIHRIQRFDSGGVLLVSSVRGTPETLEKFPLQRVMWQPGKYATVPPARNWNASPQGSGYFRIILAAADHQGIDAQWWIMVPRGRPIDALETEPGKFKVDMGMTPSGKFAQEHTDKNGVIQHIMWQQTIPMPPVMGPTSLVDIAENVHAELKLLGSTATTYLELGVKDVGGVPTTKHSTADEVAPAEFAASIKTAIEYWE